VPLPDKNGIELTREIRAFLPDTKIIIVSMYSDVDYIAKGFEAGATGFVVKESATERLIQGIKAVLNGEYYLDSSVSQAVVNKILASPLEDKKIKDAAYYTLTPREHEILPLLSDGQPSNAIAETLFISPKTVENHRTNIMRKLDLHSSNEIVRYAARHGLIDLNMWTE